MALNIPNIGTNVDALNQGVNTGSSMFARIMQPIIQREQLAQQKKIHEDSLALQKATQARLASMAPLQRRLAELHIQKAEMEADPVKKMAYIQQIMQGIHGMGGQQQGGQQQAQPMQPFTGMGMPSTEEIENPTVAPQNPQGMGGALNFTPEQELAMSLAGIKLPKAAAFQGSAREAMDLERLRQQYGEGSQVYQTALAEHQAKVDAKKDLRDLRARTKAGLKPGEKEFFDPESGEPLGKEIPLTAKERESEEGNILFNELYPYVYKGASPFSGEGSITRLQQAAANYKTDPKARKAFDDFLLAEKMLAATTVNEASTLKAGHTNQTYNRLQETLKAEDVPRMIKKFIKEYQIPASAQLRAAMRYQKLLSDARKKARTTTPATQKLFYDPEKQARHQAETEAGGEVKSVIVIDPNGKRFETTEANAAHLPKGWSRE